MFLSVKASQLFKISKDAKYVPPLAFSCRLNLSKQIEHLITRLNESNRNAVEWLSERFRDLVPPKKLVTLKQIKEVNLNADSEQICVDLFVNNSRDNICDLLLEDSVNELSRENKFTIRNGSPTTTTSPLSSNSTPETFDCRILDVKIFPKIHLVELKVIKSFYY